MLFLKCIGLLVVALLNDRIAALNDKCSNPFLCPTYDLYHSNFPALLLQHHYLADLNIVLLLLQWCPTYEILHEALSAYIVLYSIRVLCIASTSGYLSPRKIQTIHKQTLGTNRRFTDMVISGHMLSSCIIAFSNPSTLAYVLVCASAFINLSNGDHYTSDIILGVALPYLYWI